MRPKNDGCSLQGEWGGSEGQKRDGGMSPLMLGASNAVAMFAIRSRGRPDHTCVVADEFTGSAGEAHCVLSM